MRVVLRSVFHSGAATRPSEHAVGLFRGILQTVRAARPAQEVHALLEVPPRGVAEGSLLGAEEDAAGSRAFKDTVGRVEECGRLNFGCVSSVLERFEDGDDTVARPGGVSHTLGAKPSPPGRTERDRCPSTS